VLLVTGNVVLVRETDGPQTVRRHRLYHVVDHLLLVARREPLWLVITRQDPRTPSTPRTPMSQLRQLLCVVYESQLLVDNLTSRCKALKMLVYAVIHIKLL